MMIADNVIMVILQLNFHKSEHNIHTLSIIPKQASLTMFEMFARIRPNCNGLATSSLNSKTEQAPLSCSTQSPKCLKNRCYPYLNLLTCLMVTIIEKPILQKNFIISTYSIFVVLAYSEQ